MDWRRGIPDSITDGGRLLGRRVRSFSMHAAVRVRAGMHRDGEVPGLLSFIVPVYDTERYLDECLTSIRFQEYRNIEIVCVDDGSPDDSVAVVRRHRLRDPRVRLVRRPNGGLSAARNTGVAAARGEYLAFVDSDDMVPPAGYRAAVESLDGTGSDFAVLPYERWRAGVTSPAPHWVRAIHAVPRESVDVDEFPEALANAIICSKVFRRKFWDRLGLSFVEGIIYEDQQVSAEAYARADAFDVLTTTLYSWRYRADGSSISQGKREVPNLRAQFAAANESIEVLRTFASHRVVSERLLQLLSNDMPQFTGRLVGASEAYYELLREELPLLLQYLDREDYLARVPPQQKVLQHLIITGQRDAAENFVKRGLSMRNVEIHQEDVGLVVHLPYWRHPSVDVPDECFRVAERQTQVRSSVRAVAVDAPSRVTVRGWAFIENVDLAESEPQVRAFAVARGQDEVELVVRTGVDDAIDELTASGSGYADYRRGAVELDLDVDRLDAGTWHVRLDITVGEISRSGLLSAAWPAGTAALRHAATGAGGRAAMVTGGRNSPLTIEVYDDGAVVHSAVLDGDHLVLSGSGAVPDAVLLTSERHPAPLVKAGPLSGDDGWMVELPVTGLTLSATEPVACDVVADHGGELQPVRLAPAGPALGADDPRLVLGLTHAGQLTAVVHPRIAVIEDVVLDEDRLVVTLTTAGLALDDFDAHFESRPATSVGKVFSLGDGHARIELPYREERWGRAAQVLGSGSYELVLVHRESGDRVVPRVGHELMQRLPLDELTGPLRCQVQLRPAAAALLVVIAPPLPVDCRGVRNQLPLQALANQGRADEPAVFFRTLYGEVANDSGAALHHELRRRRPDLTLYWSVHDLSVQVPEGGVALVEGTREWHERLGAARFVVVNVHQPMWYRKPAGQVMIQTFHGYPYKGMGQDWWRRSGLPESRITSFLDRAREWDHLVSPSSYATPRLLEAFFRPEDAEKVDVLEVGYPRNDVLLSEEAERVRARTRSVLGIEDHQTAVLYAPTFRDYLSNDGMTAKGVKFFDPKAAADALGPSYVVLVRGHAFNARAGLRRVEGDRVVDVTYYPDIADLCLASDAAVLDYSSLRFDYALLRRPMVFLVPDEKEYHENRPAIMPYPPTAPGPRVATTGEVVRALKDLKGLRRRNADRVERFVASYLECEDGHAAERVVERVFLQ
jgi:CDP-glycerol glycerophosphotransferase